MAVLATLILLCALPQSTLEPPPQSTLKACACKPCHCGGQCSCAGSLCSCAGCGLWRDDTGPDPHLKRTRRPDGLGYCSPACTCGCQWGMPCTCGRALEQRRVTVPPAQAIQRHQPALRYQAAPRFAAPVRRGGC